MAESPKKPTESKVVTISLDEIWAYEMPGTRDIQELEPEILPENRRTLSSAEQIEVLRKSLWNRIAVSLTEVSPTWPREGERAGPGFGVLGTGQDALRPANEVLTEGVKPRESFPAGSEITLVFFSHHFGSYVHLQQVERHGNVIQVKYRFVPHVSRNLSAHLALIPIGKLPVGNYDVEIVQLPMDAKSGKYEPKEKSLGRRIVCQSFSFAVGSDEDSLTLGMSMPCATWSARVLATPGLMEQ